MIDKREAQREQMAALFNADWDAKDTDFSLLKECYREWFDAMGWRSKGVDSLDHAFRAACECAYMAGYHEAATKYNPEWME